MLLKRDADYDEMVADYNRNYDVGFNQVSFIVSDTKRIKVDLEKDNTIKYVWLHDDNQEDATGFACIGLLYLENITADPENSILDTDELICQEHLFRKMVPSWK